MGRFLKNYFPVLVNQSLMNLCVPGTGLDSENITKVKWMGLLAPKKTRREGKA